MRKFLYRYSYRYSYRHTINLENYPYRACLAEVTQRSHMVHIRSSGNPRKNTDLTKFGKIFRNLVVNFDDPKNA
jgi:hypothetical protein